MTTKRGRRGEDQFARLLVNAAQMIGQASQSLELDEAKCPACGSIHRTNWEDYKKQQQLSGMMERLYRIANTGGGVSAAR